MYSGACAAWVYKEIAESKMADTYVILGNSHMGHASCVSMQDWQTPLGTVKNDNELAEQIAKEAGLKANEKAHETEHSIEVQLPLLQFACRDSLKTLKIVPILTGPHYRKVAEGVNKALIGKNAVVIASSDFTHYGISYGYMPFHTNIKENVHKLDKGAIDWVLKRNAYRLTEYAEQTGATICGIMPIAALIEAVTAQKAELLQYYTSADITGDYSSAVGYAAVAFR
jgi:AmmeMemoRadiSam system protein B